MAGQWDPTNLPIRPGLYINFREAAAAAISGGPRGTVAIPLVNYDGDATAEQFYTVETENDAIELFGSDNIRSVRYALQAGASRVLAYTLPTIDDNEDAVYNAAFEEFETRQFNVFVFDGEVTPETQQSALNWTKDNREAGKHFMIVFGGSAADDQDPEAGNSRSQLLEDEYAVNLITGVVDLGSDRNSSEYAPYVAGMIAGAAINESITYDSVPVDDVTKRLRPSAIDTALEAGSFVIVNDGNRVRVERGQTTSGHSIRVIRARQIIATDIAQTAADSFIGVLNNNEDGRATLRAAIMNYLEMLENENVLIDPVVEQDPDNESTGDRVFLVIEYTEVDSMERIFLTINV